MDGEIIPLEIKSGKGYKKHSALNNVLESEKNSVESAIVFSNNNLEEDKRVLYAPIYMVMCIEEQKMTDTIYSIRI